MLKYSETSTNQNTEPKAWDQQEKESNKGYNYFLQFLRLGPDRKIGALAAQTGKSQRLLYYFSREHKWFERARAYDEWLEGERQKDYMEDNPVMRNPVKQITADLLQDYTTLLLEWRNRFIEVVNADGGVDTKELKTLIDMRDTLDILARRAARMPTTYHAPVVIDEGAAKKDSEPRQLGWGETTPSTIRISADKVKTVNEESRADEDDEV